jgi:hypothetical protein
MVSVALSTLGCSALFATHDKCVGRSPGPFRASDVPRHVVSNYSISAGKPEALERVALR